MNKIYTLFLLMGCLLSGAVHAYATDIGNGVPITLQSQRSISGKVIDNTGEPIIGANIVVRGTATGTITDVEGNFTLSGIASGAVLRISYIGYVTQEVTLTTRNDYQIVLIDDSRALDEVVVVGYGTMKKGDVTSAVASVRSEDFLKGAVIDATQLIQGKIAGLSVITPTGDPTQSTEIMLRGISSITSGNSPLILIDGVPGDLNTIAPDDIEAIDVLKDGSAAAIYGTRGTNGVIIITTKQVRGEVKPTFGYSTKLSTQQIVGKLDFMSADQYRSYMNGATGYTDWGGDTNWLDLITRTPFKHEHNLSFKAGSANANVIANVNFKENPGIFKRTGTTDFRGRIGANYKILNDRINFNLALLNSQREYWPRFESEFYRQAIMRNPTDYPYDNNGNYIDRPEVYWYYNPVQSINESNGEHKQYFTQMNGGVTLSLIKGLDAKMLISRRISNAQRGTYNTSQHVSGYRENRNGVAGRSYDHSIADLLELTLDYKATLHKHSFTVLGGYSYQFGSSEGFSAGNWNFSSDSYSWHNLANGAGNLQGLASMGSYKNSSKLVGFFGRGNYNYDNRYLLMGSLRYEGSSKFGADHKWGLFPAISAGWRISEEAFMEGVTFVDDLKLRVGYGVTGTDSGSPYLSLSSVNYNTGSQFWTTDGWVPELVPVRNPNPDLRWEKKKETNIGLDYELLDGRIYGGIDYYVRKTVDVLWDYSVSVPPYIFSSIRANVGVLKNKGIEISVGGIPVRLKDFQWNTVVNYSTNSNKLVSLSNDVYMTNSEFIEMGNTGEPIQARTHRLYEGGKVGDFWGFKTVDIDDDGIWIIETPEGERVSYYDAKPEDRQVIGNGAPKHYLSWNNTFRYKAFDLEVNMRGALGFDILNFPRLYYENPKLAQYNRLTSAMDPIYGKHVRLDNDLAYVSYYIEKGNYMKIDNVSFGYTFDLKKKNTVKGLRLYLSAQNLITFTGYSGIDPEVNTAGLTPGNDYRDKYPTTRTYTFGLNIIL